MTTTADNATVLVVEDEALIAMMVEDTLAGAGYRPVHARDGRPVPSCQSDGGSAQAAVVGLRCADGLDGRQVVRRLREQRPSAPGCAIVGSGTREDEEDEDDEEPWSAACRGRSHPDPAPPKGVATSSMRSELRPSSGPAPPSSAPPRSPAAPGGALTGWSGSRRPRPPPQVARAPRPMRNRGAGGRDAASPFER